MANNFSKKNQNRKKIFRQEEKKNHSQKCLTE